MTTIQKNRDILAEQKRELFHALEAHDYDSLTVLLDDSPELIDKHDPSNYTLLHKAIEQVNPKMVGFLLARGASQQLRRSAYNTALDLAMHLTGDTSQIHQVVRLLIEHGADVFATPKSGMSAVRCAIIRGDADLIRLIFSRHPDRLDKVCYKDMTPFDLALDRGEEASIRALCECGADPEQAYLMHVPDQIRWYPNIARALIEAGADVNRQDDETGDTCLHNAIFYDGTALVRVLLECNANVNARNALGETALNLAAQHNKEEVVRLLLSHGADVQAANCRGVTALYRIAMQHVSSFVLKPRPGAVLERRYTDAVARMQHTINITRLLLEAGADPDAPDVSGITPIHVAIGCRNYETAALLLAYSKHYHVLNPETMSPAEMEALFEQEMRSNPNCRNKEGFDHCHRANTKQNVLYP